LEVVWTPPHADGKTEVRLAAACELDGEIHECVLPIRAEVIPDYRCAVSQVEIADDRAVDIVFSPAGLASFRVNGAQANARGLAVEVADAFRVRVRADLKKWDPAAANSFVTVQTNSEIAPQFRIPVLPARSLLIKGATQ
jgi:hypothetical protein